MTDAPFIIRIIQDLMDITAQANLKFKDEAKTQLWLNTGCPELGGKQPIEMIFEGQTEKLREAINERLGSIL